MKAALSSGAEMEEVPDSDSDSEDSEVEDAGASVFKDGFINGMSYTAALPT